MGEGSDADDDDDDARAADASPAGSAPRRLVASAAGRLDKALAVAAPDVSRSRLAALIAGGAVRREDGAVVAEAGAKVKPGDAFVLRIPAPTPAAPAPEAVALAIVHEDAALIVIDKPAGMVVHPAPGSETGTLVAALLHHCGPSLSGVGGVARPGVVHRIDKDTSGLLVVAKTDAAHAALAAQFAAHAIEREYVAVLRGAPDRTDPRLAGHPAVAFEAEGWIRVDAPIDRSRADRKKMAVVAGGRRAVTRLRVEERFGPAARPVAALARCRLETGRTHQIRVHLAHLGHPLIGDPVYGRGAGPVPFPRQALHARTLGFRHPDDGRPVRFESPLPADLDHLLVSLRETGRPLPR